MAKLSILVGSTSQTVNIFIQDSSSTVGAGLSGLVYNTSGLTAYYALPKAAPVAITLATLAAATTAYSSGGFFELDATHTKGLYRLDLPNAALASGRFVTIYLYGATNMAPCVFEIELTATDNQDGVHGGMTALPNTACTTNASLLTSGTGTDQLSVASGRIDIGKALGTAVTLDANNVLNVSTKYLAGTALTGRDIGASVLLSVGTGTGQVNLSSGKVPATLASTDVTGNVAADLQTIKTQTVTCAAGVTVGAFIGNATAAIGVSAGGKITEVVLCDTLTTYTGDTPQTGDSFARIGATGSGLTSLAPSATALSTAQWTNTLATNLGTLASHDPGTTIGTSTYAGGAVASVTGNVGGSVVGSVGSVAGNVGGNVVGSVASVTAAVTLPAIPNNWITAAGIASGAFVVAVWDGAISGYTTSGTFGGALNAASSAGDPWSTVEPGAYAPGTFGNLVASKLNSLTFTTPNVLDANVAWVNQVQVKGAGTAVSPWGPV